MGETVSPLQKKERFLPLDSLRGLAALVIAFMWHYQHFGIKTGQPFSGIFNLFYSQGYLLVEMFFIVSGFVMACGYKDKILNGQITFKNYIVKRIRHVYPLVIITLVFITAEQFIYMYKTGDTFIYNKFDVFHFVTNMLCIQSGWFENSMTFNGPAWCISIEILCYIAFFGVILFLRKRKNMYLPLICSICFISLAAVYAKCTLPFFNYKYTARGILGFFLGVLLFEVYKLHKDKVKKICMFFFPAILIMLFIGNFMKTDIFGNFKFLLSIFIYPVLILSSITLKPLKAILSFKPFVFLGKCSMSIYLWHFPVQCFIMIICAYTGTELNFHKVVVWLGYIAITMSVALVSYFFVEKREPRWNKKFFEFLAK